MSYMMNVSIKPQNLLTLFYMTYVITGISKI